MEHGEGDGNRSDARARWQAANTGAPERDLLARDAAAFLHQDLSTPCLTTVAKAEGIWIEDHSGRRWMDFHGNSVHHIGYAHPRVLAAIRDQLDRLSFAPRRFACEPAVELAEKLGAIAPGAGAEEGPVHHRRLGRRRGGAEDRARRDRPLQDAVLLGRLPRRRLRRGLGRRRGDLPLRPGRPAAAGRRACRALCLLSLPLRPSGPGGLRHRLRRHGRVRAGARGRHRRRRRRADAGGALRRPAGVLGARARGVRPARRRC